MILIYINLTVMILDFVLLFLVSLKAEHIFKTRYPGLVIPKTYWADSAVTWIKTTLAYICPLFNILCLGVYLTQEEEIVERTVNKCRLRCLKEAKKNEPTDPSCCDIPGP